MHGWIHERNAQLGHADELDLTGRAMDTLERLTGTRPVGIRTPSWDFSDHTLTVIRELGLAYDSSLMADDEPYEIVAHGEPTGLVEVPVEWIRDDAPYFMMDRFSALRPYMPPRGALAIWRDEFDAAYAEGGLFQLTMHPHISGHRSRLSVLRELVEHIAGHSGVWWATHAQVADVARDVLNGEAQRGASAEMSSYATCAAAMPVTSAWSYAGATSTTSAPTRCTPLSPRSTASSSRLVMPPASGVPVPGANAGSSTSMSTEQ